jgi:hypothetical protein
MSWLATADVFVEKPPQQRRCQQRVTGGQAADCGGQRLGRLVLQQEARDAGLNAWYTQWPRSNAVMTSTHGLSAGARSRVIARVACTPSVPPVVRS